MIDTIILIAIYLVSIIFAGILGYIHGYKHAVNQTEALIDAITSEYEELSGLYEYQSYYSKSRPERNSHTC